MEEWKQIEGFPEYDVSSLGRVRRGGKILKGCPDKLGYMKISLSREGKITDGRIHRLVALAFLPNPENKPTVNHKDWNTSNNSIENLEWATALEQSNHRRPRKDSRECIYKTKSGYWQIRIVSKGYATLEEAIEVRNLLLNTFPGEDIQNV